MNFDFKQQENQVEAIMAKKTIVAKVSQFKFFPRSFRMNISLNRIHPGFWSIATLFLAVVAMHYKIENAVWLIPVGCVMYYASKHVVPFAVILVALLGMVLGIPELAFLLIFSVITMINWDSF